MAYLYFFIAPLLFHLLYNALLPKDPRQRASACAALVRGSQWQWPPQVRRGLPAYRRLKRARKPSVRFRQVVETTGGTGLQSYLLPVVLCLFQVGCCMESFLHRLWMKKKTWCSVREPMLSFTAAESLHCCAHSVRFDSDSFPIGIDCHASRCMANAPHLFKDLKLVKMGSVEGIKHGLEIKGVGVFKFKIEDDNGRTHEMKIPNTLYLPELKTLGAGGGRQSSVAERHADGKQR